MKAKQLYMATTAGVNMVVRIRKVLAIPRGVGTCASVLKLEWGIYMWLYIRHGDVVYVPFYPFY